MSIKQALLALLTEGEQYGYQLRASFEARAGGAWPLNIGQVYTTLDRLEGGGLVERREADAEGHVHYALTDAGRTMADQWWVTPAPHPSPGRDDVAMKLALAVSIPGADVARVIQVQRKSTMETLQDLTRAKRASGDADEAWALVADSLIFRAEAEVRWLDHTESRIAMRAVRGGEAKHAARTAADAKASAAPAPEGDRDEVRS
jgi:DNA-binding PadR family transcriptional regulator